MPPPVSENVVEDSSDMTPSQDTSALIINDVNRLEDTDEVAGIESPSESLDLAKSAETSKETVDEGNNESASTMYQDSNAAVPDQMIDYTINDTQGHAEKATGNGTVDISAEIQQLHRKMDELSTSRYMPPYPIPPPAPIPRTSKHKKSGMADFLFGRPSKAPSIPIDYHSISIGSDKVSEYIIIPKLNRAPWIEFQECIKLDEPEERFAVDVLVGEPEVIIDLGYPNYSSARRYRHEEEYEEDGLAADGITARQQTISGKAISRGQRPLPERIRINSNAIIKILSKIFQEDLEDLSGTRESVLMMRPFRALVRYKDEIRKWKGNLEAKLEGPDFDEDPLIETKAALDELNCLVEFIDTDLEEKIVYLSSPDCQRVFFSDIWHLFKPGDFVVSRDEKQAYRVIQVRYSTHGMKQPSLKDLWVSDAKAKLQKSPITIQCVHLDFDGEKIGPVSHNIDFYRFDGEKSIRSLDIIPLRMARTRNLKEILIKRGSTFLEVSDTQRRGVPMHYSGLELETQEEIDSQVVIDFEEAIAANDMGGKRRANGFTVEKLIIESFARMLKEEGKLNLDDVAMSWKPTLRNIDDDDDDDDSADDSDAGSTDSEGNHRRSRRAVNKNCIPECCSSEKVHDDIYVEHNRSNEFIQSQFREQVTSSERILSLAIAPRPLKEATEDENYITDDERLIISYRVYGYILRSRKWGESYHSWKLMFGYAMLFTRLRLETNFALASRWGCILLIDEADVFLEARQTENFDRNSLVAGMSRTPFLKVISTFNNVNLITIVFLRTLEYYSGILFLTTNRVGTFDEAFTSRIHMSLYYPPLSKSSTLAVFNVNLTRIRARFERKKERGEADLELDEPSIRKFILGYYAKNKEARWNGRQIRNACQTALALAEFEAQKLANPAAGGARSVMDVAAMSKKMVKVRLTSKYFQDVAKAYLAFMRYLREVHGVSAAQQAKNFRLRHDRYGLGEPTSLLASRQRAFEEEVRPSYGPRYGAGGAGSPKRQQGQRSRGPTYRQPYRDYYIDEEEYLDDYTYGEEEYYDQESGHDPRQYDEDDAGFEDESLNEQEDEYDEKHPDFEDEEAAYEYTEELGDENSLNQSEYDHVSQVKPRVRPGPSQAIRREQLPARGTGRVKVMVGDRGSVPSPSRRVSNRGSHASMGRGKAPARGQGRRGVPRHRVSGPGNADEC
ncbi:hypothetical protein IL306_010857 [Fusarium sp. DS 682]|nr:hypothetical protein IL306_010857 [Fusarium sp. DS 682]